MRYKFLLVYCFLKLTFYNSYGETKLILPVKNSAITSDFGYRNHPIIGGKKFHCGIDISGRLNQDVYSIGSGIVIYAGKYLGYGNLVVIKHSKGVSTHYAHLRTILKKVGEIVKTSSKIGTIGISGQSTGPHLHFEIRQNGEPIDPQIIYK